MGARNPWDEMPETVPGAAVERQLGAGRYAFHARTSAVSWWGSFMLLLVTAFCVMMIFVISGESEWTNAILFVILGACTFLGAIAVPLAARYRPGTVRSRRSRGLGRDHRMSASGDGPRTQRGRHVHYAFGVRPDARRQLHGVG